MPPLKIARFLKRSAASSDWPTEYASKTRSARTSANPLECTYAPYSPSAARARKRRTRSHGLKSDQMISATSGSARRTPPFAAMKPRHAISVTCMLPARRMTAARLRSRGSSRCFSSSSHVRLPSRASVVSSDSTSDLEKPTARRHFQLRSSSPPCSCRSPSARATASAATAAAAAMA